MVVLRREDLTGKQIEEVLHAPGGSREIHFRFDLLRDGAVLKHLDALGSVTYREESEIKHTARFKIYDTDINWLTDRIQPYMLVRMPDKVIDESIQIMPVGIFDSLNLTAAKFDQLNLTAARIDAGMAIQINREEVFAEFPLGVFIPSTPTRVADESGTYYNVEAFDLTVILQEDSLTERLFFPAGTKYLDAVQSILVGAGVDQVFIVDESEAAFQTDREFEIGERKLALCNTLLEEISFNQLTCDENGNILVSRYREPTPEQIAYTYRSNENSVVLPQISDSIDYYNVPNVFIAVCSNPELEQDFRSVYVNDNPNSKLSTVRRGRRIVSEVFQPDMIANQEALDEYVRRIAFEQSQVNRKIQFYTLLMPIHGVRDVLLLDCEELVNGIYVQTGWTMELQAGARMLHEAKGLVEV